jgi:hypothetical protein
MGSEYVLSVAVDGVKKKVVRIAFLSFRERGLGAEQGCQIE